jgi:uncharacterized membrane protein YdjX (TVP38/TMEM64 family)
MLNFKTSFAIFVTVCLVATGLAGYLLGGIDPALMRLWLKAAGVWAPVTYITVYVVATILILPSTALNLMGGAIFGPWLGTFWTSIGAIIAAIASFAFARTVGREVVTQRLAGRWQAIDAEVQQGAVFYMFAIRLMPIMPYGLVNLAAGLTSISFKNYLIGTTLGTVPGILPFVLLGSSDILPLITALALIGMLVGGSTWYRRRRTFPSQNVNPPSDRKP